MPRPARRVLNTFTALSLLLCAATVALWARSHWISDRVHWANAGGWLAVNTAQGSLEIGFLRADWSTYPQAFYSPRFEHDPARGPFNWTLLMGGAPGDALWSTQHAGF